jgi:hypothetical protein
VINAHPSEALQQTTHYMVAWFAALALLIGLAAFSGRTAVGIALGVLLGAALVLVGRKGASGG